MVKHKWERRGEACIPVFKRQTHILVMIFVRLSRVIIMHAEESDKADGWIFHSMCMKMLKQQRQLEQLMHLCSRHSKYGK